jgi:hypothetical protein
LSEALIFASTNPKYDDRLFIELQVQYMKIPSSNLGRGENFVHNMFSQWSAKRRASDKDLPVQYEFFICFAHENMKKLPSNAVSIVSDASTPPNGDKLELS